MEQALKPCPFCGGEATIGYHQTESLWSHNIVTYTKVGCDECDFSISTEPGYEFEAPEAWNRRSTPVAAAPVVEAVAWLTRGIKPGCDPLPVTYDETHLSAWAVSYQGGPSNRLWWSEAFPVYGSETVTALQSQVQTLQGENERLAKERHALKAYAHEATKAITGLTAGGSEFFGRMIGGMYTADLPFCVERIRDRFEREAERYRQAFSDSRARSLQSKGDANG